MPDSLYHSASSTTSVVSSSGTAFSRKSPDWTQLSGQCTGNAAYEAGVDATDDYVDPKTGETHGIDGLNLWPTLVAGDGAAPRGREWLPTTERSLIWDDGAGHMYKIVLDEFKSNRFHRNGSQYMDDRNPCLAPGVPFASSELSHSSSTSPRRCGTRSTCCEGSNQRSIHTLPTSLTS